MRIYDAVMLTLLSLTLILNILNYKHDLKAKKK